MKFMTKMKFQYAYNASLVACVPAVPSAPSTFTPVMSTSLIDVIIGFAIFTARARPMGIACEIYRCDDSSIITFFVMFFIEESAV